MKYMEAEGKYNPLHVSGQANIFQALLRGMRVACHLLYAILLAAFYPMLNLPARQFILQHWSRALLNILQVRMETSGHLPPQGMQGALLVANHISWMDVYALNAIQPASFVAKSEVQAWPLLGLLCRRAQTIFIERNIRRDTMRVNSLIAGRLAQGECVALFPEGTTTDGTQVRHFHSSLLQCAIDTDCTVYPVAIRYHDGSGRQCNDAAFIGDMTFIQSLRRILFSHSLHATLVFLPAISCTGKNRRILAAESHTAIRTTMDNLPLRSSSAAHTVPRQHLHHLRHDSVMTNATMRPAPHHSAPPFQSAYSLLLSPVFKLKKHSSEY